MESESVKSDSNGDREGGISSLFVSHRFRLLLLTTLLKILSFSSDLVFLLFSSVFGLCDCRDCCILYITDTTPKVLINRFLL